MLFSIYHDTRQGPRPSNQDRLAHSYTKEALLIVLADGMGGYRYGEIAAQMAVKSLVEAFEEEANPTIKDPKEFLARNIMLVNDAILAHGSAKNLLDTPRTTIVAAIVQDYTLYFAHVGDSRLYHFRKSKLVHKTEDHSVVQFLLKRGIIKKEQMRNHPDKNKIFNCLGSERPPKIEIGKPTKLKYGDIVLLCSDGVWSMVNDVEISNILHTSEIDLIANNLLNLCERRSSIHGDNMSAIALEWGQRGIDLGAVSTISMTIGKATTKMENPAKEGNQTTAELTDIEIENAIAEIQAALKKTKPI